jgi:hypothetical protein
MLTQAYADLKTQYKKLEDKMLTIRDEYEVKVKEAEDLADEATNELEEL